MQIQRARAKINLFLHVTGREADGYHTLESLMVFADYGDEVTAESAETLSLSASGPYAKDVPLDESNLVLKAARALQKACGITAGAALHLQKNLPVASGIGGGSADAAAALRALVLLWGCDISQAALKDIALALGADVPACVLSRNVLARGRGEKLAEVVIPFSAHLVLVNPLVAVSTANVFQAFDGAFDAPMQSPPAFHSWDAWIGWLSGTHNALCAAACSIAPQINAVLSAIKAQKACAYAGMSGSGATCFGIFSTAADAAYAAEKLSAHTGWWVKATTIGADNDQA